MTETSSMEAEYLACFFAIQDGCRVDPTTSQGYRPGALSSYEGVYRQPVSKTACHETSASPAFQAHRHQVSLNSRQGSRSGDRAGPRTCNGAASGLPHQDPPCGCVLATCGSNHAC